MQLTTFLIIRCLAYFQIFAVISGILFFDLCEFTCVIVIKASSFLSNVNAHFTG